MIICFYLFINYRLQLVIHIELYYYLSNLGTILNIKGDYLFPYYQKHFSDLIMDYIMI